MVLGQVAVAAPVGSGVGANEGGTVPSVGSGEVPEMCPRALACPPFPAESLR